MKKRIKRKRNKSTNDKWIYPTDIVGFGRCPHCNSLWDYSLISNKFFKHCPRCGQAVKQNV